MPKKIDIRSPQIKKLYKTDPPIKVGILILNTILKFSKVKNKTKKDPLKFQKIQNRYKEPSNKNIIENRPSQKWAF